MSVQLASTGRFRHLGVMHRYFSCFRGFVDIMLIMFAEEMGRMGFGACVLPCVSLWMLWSFLRALKWLIGC